MYTAREKLLIDFDHCEGDRSFVTADMVVLVLLNDDDFFDRLIVMVSSCEVKSSRKSADDVRRVTDLNESQTHTRDSVAKAGLDVMTS